MILITGATGLVGRHLLHKLTAEGRQVRAFSRHKTDLAEFGAFIESQGGHESQLSLIEWFEGDIRDYVTVIRAVQGISQVYHCAAFVSFDPRDRSAMLRINVEGTANLVNACLLAGDKRVCHVSSIASLGRPEYGGIIDEQTKWKTSRLNSGYAISKYGAEREIWRGIEEGLDAVIINPSVILGTGGHPGSANRVLLTIRKMLPFYNKGVNGYVDVRDVSNAMVLLMESDKSGERYVLNSENLSLQELFTLSAGLLGKRPPFIPIGHVIMSIAWRLEWLRSRLIRKPAIFTRENLRSARAKSFYSSEKFRKAFNYDFIPVKQSLEDSFTILGWLRK